MSAKSLRGALFMVAAAWVVAAGGCHGETTPGSHVGTETNWLSDCTSSDECGSASCICGICTLDCSATKPCPAAPAPDGCAENTAALTDLCGSDRATGVCMPRCSAELACGPAFVCIDGFCIPQGRVPDSGSSGGSLGLAGSGAVSGSGGVAGSSSVGGASGAVAAAGGAGAGAGGQSGSSAADPVGTIGEVRCVNESCVVGAPCCFHVSDPNASQCGPSVCGATDEALFQCDSRNGGCDASTYCVLSSPGSQCLAAVPTGPLQLCSPDNVGECQTGTCLPYVSTLVPDGYYACQF